jgi:hypothetical protein
MEYLKIILKVEIYYGSKNRVTALQRLAVIRDTRLQAGYYPAEAQNRDRRDMICLKFATTTPLKILLHSFVRIPGLARLRVAG